VREKERKRERKGKREREKERKTHVSTISDASIRATNPNDPAPT
jgi:hypothetical protein